MKNFNFGLVFGACAGLVLSLFKDKNGQRLGANLKTNFDDTKSDVIDLKQSVSNAQDAVKRLNQNLPSAKRAVSDIEDDIKNYQDHTKYSLGEIQYRIEQIQNKLDSNTNEKNN